VTRREDLLASFVGVVALAFFVSLYLEQRPEPTIQQAVLHERSAAAETVYVERQVERTKAVTSYRTLRDTLLTHTTDTLVRQVVAKADTVIAKDSAALQAADRVIAAKNAELVEALRPHPAPRLRFSVAGLYEPVAARYSASGEASLRVIGGVAVLARIDAPIGERPHAQLGLSLAF
jgi:hypothetical protein